MPHTPGSVPDFTKWPSFPFEGELRVKQLDDPVAVEPPRKGEDSADCSACAAPDEAYIWVSDRWRVRAMDRPTGLPMVLILESRSHLDLGDLPNLLAAELGVMTVRLERAIRSLDGVARVHVNRWGDGAAHLHVWFLARPRGRLQLRGTFLSLWDDILPPIPESQWRENLALVAAWLAEFGGRPLAAPPRIEWQAPSSLTDQVLGSVLGDDDADDARPDEDGQNAPTAARGDQAMASPGRGDAGGRATATPDAPGVPKRSGDGGAGRAGAEPDAAELGGPPAANDRAVNDGSAATAGSGRNETLAASGQPAVPRATWASAPEPAGS
ncbi:hypothetical protein [Micromonospora pattaloongensis]|uniref:hypothetical protein n=1 Tax=Micromonospora pattaloongensis TaxID=405436 RepID=UPI000B0EA412